MGADIENANLRELKKLLAECNDFIENAQAEWEDDLRESQQDYQEACQDVEEAKREYEQAMKEARAEHCTPGQLRNLEKINRESITDAEEYQKKALEFLRHAQKEMDRFPKLLEQAKADKIRIEARIKELETGSPSAQAASKALAEPQSETKSSEKIPMGSYILFALLVIAVVAGYRALERRSGRIYVTYDDPPTETEVSSEPDRNIPVAPTPSDADTILFLGKYAMIGSGDEFGAYLSIHQNDQGTIILEGSAHHYDHIGEVSGIVQTLDSCHFYVEDYGSRLDITYDPDTQRLSVEESGDPLGGTGVTFTGNYVDFAETSFDAVESNVPSTSELPGELFFDWMHSFVGVPSDIVLHWLEPGVVTAEVHIESVLPEAFAISGYVDILMVQSEDGSWYAENYDDYTLIFYNYSDEYRDYAETCGVWIESDVTIANGYAAITVMPMDFTGIGTDPTRDPVRCYLESYHDSTESSVEYRLWDGIGRVQVLLDAQMQPAFFQLDLS